MNSNTPDPSGPENNGNEKEVNTHQMYRNEPNP